MDRDPFNVPASDNAHSHCRSGRARNHVALGAATVRSGPERGTIGRSLLSFRASALMRILVRTSKWAVWARRFGALALPLAAIPVLLHRGHLITSDNFLAVEAVAMAVAVAAVAMAIVAFVRLWFTGDQGWG